MDNQQTIKRGCPYWASREQICKILDEGIFIPLGDHVELYCKGMEYPLCQRYALAPQAGNDTAYTEFSDKDRDRRHSQRIKSNHRLTFCRLSDSGHVISEHPSLANTLDLSSGGMRMSMRELLMFDSMIQFRFAAPFSSSLKTGLAKVKWCSPTKNNLSYQAGLSFQNDHVIQAVYEYLHSQSQA